jgi:hypothetical protein
MLLKRRPPQFEESPARPAPGFEHLSGESIAMIGWLKANQVEFVLVGPVADAIRGGAAGARGPVAIVPAPYSRNLARLARALGSVHARPRPDGSTRESADAAPAKLTADMLSGDRRWPLRFGVAHYLDVEGRANGGSGYQDLLYEAGRFELASGLHVEVASPEDIEHYAHLHRTGAAPEMRITRSAVVEHETT